MKRQIIILSLSLLALIFLLPTAVRAEDVDINVDIGEILYLQVHGGPLDWTGDYKPDAGDFNADVTNFSGVYESNGYGWTNPQTVQCRIYGIIPWQIQVKGNAGDTFVGTLGASDSKPLSDILWMDGVINGWHQLTESFVYVDDGPVPSGDYYALDVTFRVLLHWENDCPGTYTYNSVQFTVLPY